MMRMATGTYITLTMSTVFLLIRRPPASALLPLKVRPTMADDTPPMVVAIPHQDKKVRSLAGGSTGVQGGKGQGAGSYGGK